jgi:hypothetical protein
VRHIRDPRFNPLYDALPSHVRDLADKNFALLKQNPKHPSLRFKRLMGDVWSVRVGRDYRALAMERKDYFDGFGSALTPNMIGS